jgi:hypothetical protein
MNWYLWIIFGMNALAAVMYLSYAVAGKDYTYTRSGNNFAWALYAAVGLGLLFWTTWPLNTLGWLYVAYSVFTNAFSLYQGKRPLYLSASFMGLLGLICTMWAVLIVTVGFTV